MSSSFTVTGYASKNFAVSFDIMPAGCQGDPSNEELIELQSKGGTFDRVLFLEAMYSSLVDCFGNDFKFVVHFMNLKGGRVWWNHFFEGATSCMGGYIDFHFPNIRTLPDMMERLEAFATQVRQDDTVPTIKFVHLRPYVASYGGVCVDTHKFVVKDGVVHERGIIVAPPQW